MWPRLPQLRQSAFRNEHCDAKWFPPQRKHRSRRSSTAIRLNRSVRFCCSTGTVLWTSTGATADAAGRRAGILISTLDSLSLLQGRGERQVRLGSEVGAMRSSRTPQTSLSRSISLSDAPKLQYSVNCRSLATNWARFSPSFWKQLLNRNRMRLAKVSGYSGLLQLNKVVAFCCLAAPANEIANESIQQGHKPNKITFLVVRCDVVCDEIILQSFRVSCPVFLILVKLSDMTVERRHSGTGGSKQLVANCSVFVFLSLH